MAADRHGARSGEARAPRAATAAVGGVLALVALTGSGCAERGAAADGQPGGSPRETVRRVADVLAGTGTSRARTSMVMASGGTRVTVRGEGVFDYDRGIGRLLVRLPRDVSGVPEQRSITELIVPGALYMKNRGAGVPSDKWVRIDTADLSDGNLVSSGVTDPISAAELLRGARRVSYVGKRELDGVTVRHYRGTAHIGEAAGAASPRLRRQLAAAAEGFSGATVPFEVYLDGQGRLRRVRHEFTVVGSAAEGSGTGGTGGVGVASTTTLYGFGTPVAVDMPEPDDIYTGEIATP